MPIFKFGMLLVRTLSKPVANGIKARAVEKPGFRKVCHDFAQVWHRLEVKLNLGLMGHTARVIKPLDEATAVKTGAEILGEAIIFGIAAVGLLAENRRNAINEARKAANLKMQFDNQTKRIAELESSQIDFQGPVDDILHCYLHELKTLPAVVGPGFRKQACCLNLERGFENHLINAGMARLLYPNKTHDQDVVGSGQGAVTTLRADTLELLHHGGRMTREELRLREEAESRRRHLVHLYSKNPDEESIWQAMSRWVYTSFTPEEEQPPHPALATPAAAAAASKPGDVPPLNAAAALQAAHGGAGAAAAGVVQAVKVVVQAGASDVKEGREGKGENSSGSVAVSAPVELRAAPVKSSAAKE